jgi:hypothetical protein
MEKKKGNLIMDLNVLILLVVLMAAAPGSMLMAAYIAKRIESILHK